MSWLLALALGAGTTGEAMALLKSDYSSDLPRYAIVPGFWAVWFAPSMNSQIEHTVFFGTNTVVWAAAWRCCPTLATYASTALGFDAAIGSVWRFLQKNEKGIEFEGAEEASAAGPNHRC